MSGTTEAAQKHDINPRRALQTYCYAPRTTVSPLPISSRPGELKSEVKLQRDAVNTNILMQLHAKTQATAAQDALRGGRPRGRRHPCCQRTVTTSLSQSAYTKTLVAHSAATIGRQQTAISPICIKVGGSNM